MGWKREYDLEFKGLREGLHQFEYTIEDKFFEHFEQKLVTVGNLVVKVQLLKRSTFLKLDFHIEGWVELICDRCLEKYRQFLEYEDEIFVKSGDNEKVDDDKVIWVTVGEHSVNIAQLIYEFIIISIPLKHVHPDDDNGLSGCDIEMIREIEKYTYNNKKYKETDPRWAVLKKIGNNN
jgi:uncharacterized protein